MTAQNFAETTVKYYEKKLYFLSKNTDLFNPSDVKCFIRKLQVSTSYKRNLVDVYKKFMEHYNLRATFPKYRKESRLVRIPTTKEINTIISEARRGLKRKLELAKQTGLRPIELISLRVKDFDTERRIIHPSTAKGGSPRILKISKELAFQLEADIVRKGLQPNQRIFGGKVKSFQNAYHILRKRVAEELKQPNLKTIRLYDFRHYFATMLYARTKDILFVKQQMGHKKLETTLMYTQLVQFAEGEEYVAKVAANQAEAISLIEAGFEYVTTIDGGQIFRKPK
jgi:integrase/recombinase XerD